VLGVVLEIPLLELVSAAVVLDRVSWAQVSVQVSGQAWEMASQTPTRQPTQAR
jgi:hypothetical protein